MGVDAWRSLATVGAILVPQSTNRVRVDLTIPMVPALPVRPQRACVTGDPGHDPDFRMVRAADRDVLGWSCRDGGILQLVIGAVSIALFPVIWPFAVPH
jgi:hypothetical protein